MNAPDARIHIDRIVVRGGQIGSLDASDVRAAVAEHLTGALAHPSLPAGRAIRSGVVVGLAALPAGSGPLGRVVANVISGAARGPSRG